MTRKAQHGVFLLEALIAILIFSLGILGMVAMGTTAIATQSDAQYRTEAANYANEIATAIALDMAPANYTAQLANYAHRPIDGGYCVFGGGQSLRPIVTAWVDRVRGLNDAKTGLPGATNLSEQIAVDQSVTGFNKVTITVCWQPPSNAGIAIGTPMHRHTLITYING